MHLVHVVQHRCGDRLNRYFANYAEGLLLTHCGPCTRRSSQTGRYQGEEGATNIRWPVAGTIPRTNGEGLWMQVDIGACGRVWRAVGAWGARGWEPETGWSCWFRVCCESRIGSETLPTCTGFRPGAMGMASSPAEPAPLWVSYAAIEQQSQGVSTFHDAASMAVSGAFTPGTTSSCGPGWLTGASYLRPACVTRQAAALTANTSSSGRSAGGQCGEPARNSGTEGGFAAWICGRL